MRYPLLAPLAAIATGILVSRAVPFDLRDLPIIIAVFAALAVVALRRNPVLSGACCLLAMAFAGILSDVWHRPGPRPELDVNGRELAILAGCVADSPVADEGRVRFTLELEPGVRVRTTLYLPEGEPVPVLHYGQRVEVDARVRRTRNFQNPGAFDYSTYLARRSIFWTASASAVRVQPGVCGTRAAAFIYGLRSSALARLEQLYAGKPYETGMMQGILIGESARMDKVWTEHFRSTGTIHALVISGTHVAILSAFFLFLLRLCLVKESRAMFLTVIAGWLYALVTGWEAPVIRSAAGLTLFLAGRLAFRERRIVNLLAAIGIAFLVCDPAQMLEASFQLSFLAVGFIAVFAVPLLEGTSAPLARALEGLQDTGRDMHLAPRAAQFRVEARLLGETLELWLRLPRRVCLAAVAVPGRIAFYVYELVVISAVVQVGLALPMAVYFHRLSLTGLSANVVIVPLMGLVVPIGFVALLTGWGFAAKVAGWLLAASRVVVDWHADREPEWRIPDPPAALAIALAAALILAGVAFSLSGPRSRLWRTVSSLAVLVLLAVIIVHPFAPVVAPGKLELTAIDVGQSESLFIALPSGKLMLVDGGGFPAFGKSANRSRMDIGEDVVSPYLWSRSIRRVDVLVLTHGHDDHIGGAAALIRNFRPRELWVAPMPATPLWKNVQEAAHRRGTRIVPLRAGAVRELGGARFEVLWPPEGTEPETPGNDESLALRMSWSGKKFLLAADIERRDEYRLLDSGALGPVDVLKVAHHGSRTSSTDEFVATVRPAFAVLSAGFENPYGFPNQAVLERFAQRHIPVFRTDEFGLVTIRTDGRHFEVETTRWSGGARGPQSALDRLF